MRLPLRPTAEELWKSFPAKLRSQVQRPIKEGMSVVIGQEDQLDAFYQVFAANMRDLGTPVYGKRFFQNVLRAFPDRTWIATVYLGGIPVASGFLAGFRDRLEIPWASVVRAYRHLSPNMLLYWRCLEFACQRRYRVFDFGRSTRGEGTYRFKEQWGAKPVQLYWYYWLRDGNELPQVNPTNPKYRMAIAVWQRLPLGITTQIGPSIVKYIP
jgi:FemAB-related protein (PEP-CTERM system-associated)